MTRDPVCGKEVDPLRARAVGIWGGRTYYFCSPEHRSAFASDPGAHVAVVPPAARDATPAEPRRTTPPAGLSRRTPVANPVPPPAGPLHPGTAPASDAAPLSPLDTLDTLPIEDSGPIPVPRSRAWMWVVLVTLLALGITIVAGAHFR